MKLALLPLFDYGLHFSSDWVIYIVQNFAPWDFRVNQKKKKKQWELIVSYKFSKYLNPNTCLTHENYHVIFTSICLFLTFYRIVICTQKLTMSFTVLQFSRLHTFFYQKWSFSVLVCHLKYAEFSCHDFSLLWSVNVSQVFFFVDLAFFWHICFLANCPLNWVTDVFLFLCGYIF